MLELNVDQERNFLTTLAHIDKLLSDSEHVLDEARSPSLLPEYICDISSEQRQRFLGLISQFRTEVKGLVRRHGLTPARPRKSAVNTILTNLLFADMALEEIDSKNIDHGKLSNAAAEELDGIVSQMRRLIQGMRGDMAMNAKKSSD